MNNAYLYTLISVFIVSFVSFIGVFTLAIRPDYLKKITLFLVSLSAGTLLGSSFFDLLPEALEINEDDKKIWIFLLLGIIAFFILEKIICWRHCHIPTSDQHPHHLGPMNLIGDGLHNFIDGAVIAGSFLISPQIGLITTIAVIIHEIPQELGDFGVLIYAGINRLKALFLNFAIALTSMLGAIIVLIVGSRFDHLTDFLLPFTVGGFIYIATADLIPELKKESRPLFSVIQLIFILIGLGLAYSLAVLLPE